MDTKACQLILAAIRIACDECAWRIGVDDVNGEYTIHSHPPTGDILIYIGENSAISVRTYDGPSKEDIGQSGSHYFNVIVDPNNIYLYRGEGRIVIPRKK